MKRRVFGRRERPLLRRAFTLVELLVFENTHGYLPYGDRQNDTYTKKVGPGVQILPYLEQSALYDRYDWNLNWYDPGNRGVVQTNLRVYACPSTPNWLRLFSGTEGGVAFTAAATDYIPPSGLGRNEKTFVEANFGLIISDDKSILTKKVKTPNYLRVSSGRSERRV